ncbi:MAG: hypothetical protein PHC35_00620 [Deltaproteobacteria bacterium]|nr:hypothetical protein [Deltaproteobacteria bacterium]
MPRITKTLPTIIRLCACLCMGPCLLFHGCAAKEAPPAPITGVSGPAQGKLQDKTEPAGMRSQVIAQIILKDHPQPKFRAVLTWAKTSNSINMRLTGIGALGMPIFDYLSIGENVYLSLPSEDMVYWADSEHGLSGQDMRLIATEIRLALSPWEASTRCDNQEISCNRRMDSPLQQMPQDTLLCNAISCNDGYRGMKGLTGLWAMDSSTMAPEYLGLKDMEIFYRRPQMIQSGSLYPTDITLRLTAFPLEIRMELKELETTGVLMEDPAFDPAPFLSRPALHMDELIRRIKE